MNKHIESTAHINEVAHAAKQQKRTLEATKERNRVYGEGSTAPLAAHYSQPSVPRQSMFHDAMPLQQTQTLAGVYSNVTEDNYNPELNHEVLIPAYVEPVDSSCSAREAKERMFQQIYQIMLEQAMHDDEFGHTESDSFDIDAEFTNSMREHASQEVQDPESISSYFSSIPVDSDYSPYPGKLVSQFTLTQHSTN